MITDLNISDKQIKLPNISSSKDGTSNLYLSVIYI